MAGNVGLLKHASNVPQTALYLEDLFRRAGFPDGCFQTLLIGSGAGGGVLRDPRVAAATLTGSEPAGRVGRARSRATRSRRPCWSSAAATRSWSCPRPISTGPPKIAVTARVQNNGQSCIAAKRFIVHADVYDEFAERFVARMAALRVGDPMDEATDVGPLATEQGRADVEELGRRRGRARARGPVRRSAPDRPGLVLPADRARRYHPANAHLHRGDLRSGGHAVPGRRPRRGGRARQRHRVRPGLQRLDQRRGRAGAVRRATSRPARCSSTA